ncbi:MAG TPA: hypothetical protein PLB91_16600 [Spirochaetales bacterium]|nr:hypothetical protein [Spirochaetales bacterium]HRY56117.1 spermidine synthase [Spirochaetia bacterium]HRZ66361.1 spermidine synthase [Spirochaetia bacterium]
MDLWYTRGESAGTAWCVKVERPLYSADGSSGRIEAFETGDFGLVLAAEGAITLTEAEGFALREMMVHPPLNAHAGLRSALVVGGGDGCLASELLRYPGVERVAVTEDDEAYIEAARRFLPGLAASLDDGRVALARARGDEFVRETRERFDLILVTARAARREGATGQSFYCDCFRALAGDGILVAQLGCPFFPEGRRELVTTSGRLKRLFPIFRPYFCLSPASSSGLGLLAFASKKYDPTRDFQEERWARERLETRYYDAEVHRAAFALPRCVAEVFKGA